MNASPPATHPVKDPLHGTSHGTSSLLTLFMQAPAAIAVLHGPQHTFTFANSLYQKVFARSEGQLLGKTVRQAFTEVEGQGIYELFDGVFSSGEAFSTAEYPALFEEDGITKKGYYNFVIQPLKDEAGRVTDLMVHAYEVTPAFLANKKTEQSETQLRLVTDALPQLISFLDKDYRYRFANKAYGDWFGEEGKNIYGKTMVEVIGEETFNRLKPHLTDAFAGKRVHLELQAPYKWGGHRFIAADYVPHFEEGQVTGLYVMVNDITDKKRAEERWRQNEERLRFALQAGHLGSWELDLAAMELHASELCKLNFGQPPDRPFTYEALRAAIHPDDRQRMADAVSETLATGKDYDIEYRVVWPDGSVRWMNVRGQVQRNGEGAPVSMAGVSIDVTDRKTAEEALRKSESQFRTLIEQAPVATCLFVGRELRIEIANELMIQYMGKGPDVMGKPLAEALPELRGQPVLQALDDAFTTGKTVVSRAVPADVVVDGQRSTYYFDYTFKPVRNAAGEVYGLIDMSVDVTAQVLVQRRLEESESRFQNLVREATVGVIVLTGPEMKVEIVNEAYGALIERHPGEMLNKSLFDIIPDAENYYRPLLEKVMQTGEPLYLYDSPYRIRKDGRPIEGFLNVVYQPYRNSEGKLLGVMTLCQDVTESVNARLTAERNESRFRSLIANAPMAIALFVGRDLVIENPNQIFIDLTGKGPHIAGRPLREVMPELVTENQPFLQILDDVFTTGTGFETFATQVKVTRDGVMTNNYYDFSYTPLFDAEGKVYAVLEMAADVTERETSRRRIEASEQEFKTITEAIPQLVWVCNNGGEVTFFNDRWYQFTGSSPEESLGHGWSDLVHPADVPATLLLWNEAQQTSSPIQVEYRLRHADGGYRWIVSNGAPILNADGSVNRWFGTCTDIHERKMMESALQESEGRLRTLTETLEDQVEQRTAELVRLTAELRRSNEDLQQFAHVASHDLKEPVRKIRTFGSRLSAEFGKDLPPAAKGYLQKMEGASARIYSMIDGVLLYSSLNALEGAAEPVDLNETLQDIKTDLELVIAKTGATVHHDKLPVVSGLPILLYQLFYNLLNNSLKFAKADTPPVVTIKAEPLPEGENGVRFTRLTFADNGIGFAQSQADAVFKTFTRLNPKDRYEGTGLGLSLCKKIVERHGGTINAEGGEGHGARFMFTLPLSITHDEKRTHPAD